MTETCEIRRSQKQGTLSDAKCVSTKETLRIKTPLFKATWGLPKYREIYGDGGSIVAAASKRCYTVRRNSKECEVIQQDGMKKPNLEAGRVGTYQGTNKQKIYHKI